MVVNDQFHFSPFGNGHFCSVYLPAFPNLNIQFNSRPIRAYSKEGDSPEKEHFRDKLYTQMTNSCKRLDPISQKSSNLGKQNEALDKRIRQFFELNDLSKWKTAFNGEIAEVLISVKVSVQYSLANDFIKFRLYKALQEYFIFYFKYFLIGLFKLKKKGDLNGDNLVISVKQNPTGVFDETTEDSFSKSHLLEVVLDFLEGLQQHKREVLEGTHRVAKAVLWSQFCKYSVKKVGPKLLYVKLRGKKEIIFCLHKNKAHFLSNEMEDLENYPRNGKF